MGEIWQGVKNLNGKSEVLVTRCRGIKRVLKAGVSMGGIG